MFRERASGSYRLSAYFLAKSFSDVPLYIALPTLYTAVTYPAVGLSFSDGGVNFVRFLCVLLCNSLTAQSMGLMISCAVLDFKKSMVVCGCIMLTFMLCGGFYLDPRHIPTALAWLPKAGFTTFTFPALMMIVHSPSFGALAFACEAGDEHVTQYGGACPISGQAVLDARGISDTVGENVAILIAMLIAYRIVAYCCLRYLHKPSQK